MFSREKIKDFKCSVCNNYLSVPPIHYINDNAYRCGRCSFLGNNVGARAELYEKAMNNTIFPCIYPGCRVNLEWGNVLEHEKVCSQRVVECPLCPETGLKADSLQTHLTSAHNSSRFATKLLKLDEIEIRTSFHFITFGDHSFILGILQNRDCLAFSVYSLFSDNSTFVFDVSMKTNVSCITLYDNDIDPFFVPRQCTKCWIDTCHNPLHEDYVTSIREHIFKEMTTVVKKNNLRIFLGKSLDSTIISVNVKDKKQNRQKTNYDRQVLECVHCKMVMSPPIHLCVSGHSICNDCKSEHKRCPCCQHSWAKFGNVSLEHYSENVILSCEACEFKGCVKDILEHERTCHPKKK